MITPLGRPLIEYCLRTAACSSAAPTVSPHIEGILVSSIWLGVDNACGFWIEGDLQVELEEVQVW